MSKLEELRKAIDQIDDRILELLNQRATVSLEIGRVKREEKAEVCDSNREQEVRDRLASKNQGPLENGHLLAIYNEIFSSSRAMQQPVRVACLGPRATFSHIASIQQFGSSAQFTLVSSFREVFAEVDKGLANFGVVPIENSTDGIIGYTLDLLMDTELKIAGEIMLEVTQNLMNRTGRREDVMHILSHPQPLAQCRNWLESNMKGVPVAEVSSTTKAAEMAAEDGSVAAIASRLAADIYGLKIINERIQDSAHNYTRFLVMAKSSPSRTGHDKTSILFAVKDAPGALHAMLKPFAERGINLTKIESRPSRRKAWEYHFFVDMAGHIEDEAVRAAIDELSGNCVFLKNLGSYPVAEKA